MNPQNAFNTRPVGEEGPEEEITDIIDDLKLRYTPKHFKEMNLKPGRTMTFDYEGSPVILEITRIEDERYFAKKVQLHEPTAVSSHLRHNVDATEEAIQEYGGPYCQDCEVLITEPATAKGKSKFEARKDQYLSDGTFIGDQPESRN